MKTKPIIVKILLFALCLNLFSPAFASSTTLQPIAGTGESPIREISQTDAYNNLFHNYSPNSTTNTSSNDGFDDHVLYTYEILYDPNTETYSASMNIIFNLGGSEYHTSVIGGLEQIELNQNDIFLTGPLYGTLEEKPECEVIVGFNHILGQSKISCYATFITQGIQVYARFGDDIFTPGQLNQLISISTKPDAFSNTITSNPPMSTNVVAASQYLTEGTKTATMSALAGMNGLTGKAHTCTVYFKPG